MVFKETWGQLILDGAKRMEIRGRRYKEGKYWIGWKSRIRGQITLGLPMHIKDTSTWKRLQSQHCCTSDELPYRTTWAFVISNVETVVPSIAYEHRKGAVGIVIYKMK